MKDVISYDNMRVTGYVSKPTASRKSRAMQFFFINSRLVKSATAMAALEQAYKNSIMVGRFPMCVLNIELNPALVDVNVHPAKIEVRFANEKPIFDLVFYGVKSAVEADRSVKEADFSPKLEQIYDTPSRVNKTYTSKIDFFKKKDEPPVQQSFKLQPNEEFFQTAKSTLHSPRASYDLDIEYEDKNEELPKAETIHINQVEPAVAEAVQESPATCDENDNKSIDFKLIGEAFKTYLIVEIENELYFIDKHAAHERMNYEQFRAQATVETQMLLSPVAVNLSKDEFNALCDNMDLLSQCGFEAEPFGDSAVIVRAVPSLVGDSDIKDLICEIAQKLLEHKTDITPDKIDWIYHSASCRGAVKAGDNTSPEEQRLFVAKLLSMPNIRFCPHGRPVFIKISKYDIEKQFGRV